MILTTLRDDPKLLRSELGMALQPIAIQKVKGTPWESVLFEKPSALAERRGWDVWREKNPEPADDFPERERKSIAFIADAKARKARGES